jgi:hypothetical protein
MSPLSSKMRIGSAVVASTRTQRVGAPSAKQTRPRTTVLPAATP